jgi:predicted Zn finger-like uncharacterized protein
VQIECSRCRAVFSLPESLAAAGTRFRVQCGRCLAVFEAVLAGDAAPATEPPAVPVPAESAQVLAVAPAAEPTPVRPAPPTGARFRMASRRSRIALGLLAAAVVVGMALFRVASPSSTEEKVREGREKLLLDDSKSLREATSLFTDAARNAPGQAEPEAERAFALLLQASAHKDLAARVPAAQREEETRAASRLLQQGSAAARQAIADDADALPAIRAMAFADALSGSLEPAGVRVEQAERLAPGDPWVLYVKAVTAAGARERAVQALSAARQAQPKLLRADVDLAGIAMDGGDPAGARQLLKLVLEKNPRHDRARWMLSLLPP